MFGAVGGTVAGGDVGDSAMLEQAPEAKKRRAMNEGVKLRMRWLIQESCGA
jgi:hypothetical protein